MEKTLRIYTHIMCVLSHLNRVQLFATLWTVAHQSPLSMGYARQECWSGLPCPVNIYLHLFAETNRTLYINYNLEKNLWEKALQLKILYPIIPSSERFCCLWFLFFVFFFSIFRRRLLNDGVHQNEEVNQGKERHGIQETWTRPSKEVRKPFRVIADTIVHLNITEKRFSCL